MAAEVGAEDAAAEPSGAVHHFRLSNRGIVVLLFAGSLLLHVAIFARGHSHVQPGDSGDYLSAARALLQHGTILNSRGVPATERGPGYVPVVALVMALGGGIGALTLLNHLFAALAAPLTFWVADTGTRSRTTAAIAGAVVAVHPDLLAWSDLVMSEAFFVLMFVTALLAAVHAMRTGSIRAGLLAGLAFGYAVLTRPVAILLPLVAVVALYVARQRRAAAVVLLVSYLLPAGWVVRNRVERGVAILTSTSGEIALLWRAAGAVTMQEKGFAVSLLPSAREDAWARHFCASVQPRLGRMLAARAHHRYGGAVDEVRSATVASEMGRQLIAQFPLAFIESTAHAFIHLLGDPSFQMLDTGPVIFSAPALAISMVVSVVLAAATIAGSLLVWWVSKPAGVLFSGMFWTLAAVSSGPEAALYTRFRVPLVPMMAILAAVTMVRIWRLRDRAALM